MSNEKPQTTHSSNAKKRKHAPLISLMGPDGVGKTTQAEYLEANPGIPGLAGVLTILRKSIQDTEAPVEITSVHLPPHNLFKSIAKLIFRFFQWHYEYLFGDVARARARGFLVIYDRFYFLDMFIDPLRYRYGGPLWLIKAAIQLSPGPDLIFLLDAPTEMLYARKMEDSIEYLEKWRQTYKSVLMQRPNTHLIDASKPIEESSEQIRKIIREYLSN